MKKIYLILAGTLLVSGAFSQAPLRNANMKVNHQPMPFNKTVTKTLSDLKPNATSTSGTRVTTIDENLSAISMITDYRGTTPYLAYTNPMYTDSNVIINFSSGPSSAWLYGITQTIHIDGDYNAGFGGVFDPLVQPFDENAPVTIDSIFIQGYYARDNASVVDTAIVYVMARRNGQYKRRNYFNNEDSAKYVTDYNNKGGNKTAPDSVIATYKIVLNAAFKADSLSNGGHIFTVGSNLTIPNSDGVIGIALNFKPGKAYSQATDTIFENTNWINVVYATPLGQNQTFPLGDVQDYTIGGFNDMNSKYGTWTYYMPPYVFTGHHPYQLYDVSINIKQTNTMNASINENENGATLYQNYPNPSNSLTTVKYELANAANVTFEVMDVTGKKVISSNEGNRGSGTHTIEINTSELNAGIYFYSIVVDGNMVTKKMTITK